MTLRILTTLTSRYFCRCIRRHTIGLTSRRPMSTGAEVRQYQHVSTARCCCYCCCDPSLGNDAIMWEKQHSVVRLASCLIKRCRQCLQLVGFIRCFADDSWQTSQCQTNREYTSNLSVSVALTFFSMHYDRLLAWYCRLSVCNFVNCGAQNQDQGGWKLYHRHFVFTSSDTFAA